MMPDTLNSLKGRTAVVTGASSGIGLATARALCEEGVRVAMVARTWQHLESAGASLGGNALPIACDVSKPADVERAVAAIREAFSNAPDFVINNAGLFTLGKLDTMSPESFAEVVNLNLVSPFRLVRAFLPEMLRREKGHIVTIGSEADHRVFPENGAYAASKYGARALHEVTLLELRGRGVRATLVSPGPVDTPLWDKIDPDNRKGFMPRASMLNPDNVAAAIIFAVSQPESVNVDEVRLSSS